MPPKGFINRETKYQKYITKEEFQKILEWLESRLHSPSSRMATYIMAYLGLRVGEAIRLKRENFNDDFSLLRYFPLKKKQPIIHERCIPTILQEKLQMYDFCYSKHYRNGYLFFPYKNQSQNSHIQRNTIEFIFMRMRKELNLQDIYFYRKNGTVFNRISPHTLRHYFSYCFFEASGKDIKATSEVLCHKDITMTARYINALMTGQKEREIINRAF